MQNGTFTCKEEAQTEIVEYIEMDYNSVRRHSGLNYVSPRKFERLFYHN